MTRERGKLRYPGELWDTLPGMTLGKDELGRQYIVEARDIADGATTVSLVRSDVLHAERNPS